MGNPADVVEVPADLVTDIVKGWHMNKNLDVSDLEQRIDWWLEEGGDERVLCQVFRCLLY